MQRKHSNSGEFSVKPVDTHHANITLPKMSFRILQKQLRSRIRSFFFSAVVFRLKLSIAVNAQSHVWSNNKNIYIISYATAQ